MHLVLSYHLVQLLTLDGIQEVVNLNTHTIMIKYTRMYDYQFCMRIVTIVEVQILECNLKHQGLNSAIEVSKEECKILTMLISCCNGYCDYTEDFHQIHFPPCSLHICCVDTSWTIEP